MTLTLALIVFATMFAPLAIAYLVCGDLAIEPWEDAS